MLNIEAVCYFIDIHTHNTETNANRDVVKIVNAGFDDIYINKVSNIFYSIGIHPWDLEKNENFADKLSKLNYLIDNEMIIALGEVGLDKKHKETFGEQERIFIEEIKISENCRKPMIIHNVGSGSEMISLHKRLKIKMPWIIHGFQGSLQEAEQMISHGFYLSLGEVLYRNENQAETLLKAIPTERLFLETDVSGRDICEVYSKAAKMMEMKLEDLRKSIFLNFADIFKV